jgi:hypothetical protein
MQHRAENLWEHPPYWRAVGDVADALLAQPYHWLPSAEVRRIMRSQVKAE